MSNYNVNDLTRQVASILRGLMARYDVTQAQLADAVGVSQSQLSKQVRGLRPIDIDQLDGMASAFGRSAGAILQEAESVIADFDVDPATNLIFVDEGIKLPEPWNTRKWTRSTTPVVPPASTRRRNAATPDSGATTTPSEEDE